MQTTKILRYILVFLLNGAGNLFFINLVNGQECSDVTLNDARKSYELGKFTEVISALNPCIRNGFNEKQKVEAYRLMAMSWLAVDSIDQARSGISELLMINPDYEANLFDPPGFIRLVNSLKLAGEIQLVTSVSKKAENITEAPATIVVITRDEIEKRGYNDLVELIKDIPGFDLTLFYGSEYANIYQRGFRQNNTEKTLLLVDGIEENDLWTNWAYVDRQYPLSNIERVEIIYGPASTMYGPNAFAGVINVISRNSVSAVRQGKMIGVSANGAYGTYNTRSLDVTVSGAKQNLSFSLTGRMFLSDEMDLSSQEFFDYDPSVYDNIDYLSLLSVKSNAKEYLKQNNLPESHPYYSFSSDSSRLNLSLAGAEAARKLDKSAYNQIINGHKIGFSNKSKEGLLNGKFNIGNFTIGFQTWKYSRGSTTQYTDIYVPGSDNGFNWAPRLTCFYTKYENRVHDKLFISNLTTYRIHTLTEDSRFVSLTNYARGNKGLAALVRNEEPAWTTQYAYESSNQLRTEMKAIYTPSNRFDLVSGIELRHSNLQGSYLFSLSPTPQDSAVIQPSPKGGNSFNVFDAGIYSQGTYAAMKNLRFTLGIRYDFNRVRSRNGFGSEISPRFAAVYSPGKYTLKAIYSRGIMNVSNWTKYSSAGNRIPNPDLKTENIQNLELSGAYRLSKNFNADLNLYRNYIDDVVGTVAIQERHGMTQNDNIGKFMITGAQANIFYQNETLTAWMNYTFCYPRQTFSETGKVDNRVSDISSHQFNIGINKRFSDHFNLNLRSNFTGKRKTGPGTTVPLNTASFPAVAVFNGTILYSELLNIAGLDLQLVCNNILNKEYYHPGTKAADGYNNPTGILQRGRHFLIQTRFNF